MWAVGKQANGVQLETESGRDFCKMNLLLASISSHSVSSIPANTEARKHDSLIVYVGKWEGLADVNGSDLAKPPTSKALGIGKGGQAEIHGSREQTKTGLTTQNSNSIHLPVNVK